VVSGRERRLGRLERAQASFYGPNLNDMTHGARQQISRSAVRGLEDVPTRDVAMLVNPKTPDAVPEIGSVQMAAQSLGLRLKMFKASTLSIDARSL
jgi:hypothetical protein